MMHITPHLYVVKDFFLKIEKYFEFLSFKNSISFKLWVFFELG